MQLEVGSHLLPPLWAGGRGDTCIPCSWTFHTDALEKLVKLLVEKERTRGILGNRRAAV